MSRARGLRIIARQKAFGPGTTEQSMKKYNVYGMGAALSTPRSRSTTRSSVAPASTRA